MLRVITAISTGTGSSENEDRIGWREAVGITHIWLIDGATSASDRRFIDESHTDGAWYAERLSTLLYGVEPITAGTASSIVNGALVRIAAELGDIIKSKDIPQWAWPLAALSFLRISASGASVTIEGIHLGDCPVYAVGDEVKTIWEHHPRHEVRLNQPGEIGKVRALSELKRQRELQHSSSAPTIAGMNPAAINKAGRTSNIIPVGSLVMLMTDGFARVFDEYKMIDKGVAIRQCCSKQGALEILQLMRRFERTSYEAAPDRMLKASDDASCAVIECR